MNLQSHRPSSPPTPPTPPPSKRAMKAAERQKRKEQRALELETILQETIDAGYTLVFTDVSPEKFDVVGRLGGYGVHSDQGVSAELLAALRAMQLHPAGKIAICSDSAYVLLGVHGAAKRWKIRGWTGSCGPVSNVPIWEEVLSELDKPHRMLKWIKVPSHVTVEGNNEADRLAALGLRSHLLYPLQHTLQKTTVDVSFTPPPLCKKARISPQTPPAQGLQKQLDFSIASPPAVPLGSARGAAILSSLNLEALSDQTSLDRSEPAISDGSATVTSDGSATETASTVSVSVADSSDGFSTDVSDTRKT